MSKLTRHQRWRAAKVANPGMCACGRPAVGLRAGHEAVCEWCRARNSGLVVLRKLNTKAPLKGKRTTPLHERMVDPFETNGRGWGSLDALEQQLARL